VPPQCTARRRPGCCRDAGSEDRRGWRLQGEGKAVHQIDGFREEGAHHMELSTMAWISDGNLVMVARTAGRRRRLGVQRGV
jgi:hypothetical protein